MVQPLEMNESLTYLLKEVRVTDATSMWNNQTVDVLIRNGRVEDIQERIHSIPEHSSVVYNLNSISPGWIDPWNHGAKPGEEQFQSVQEWTRQLAQSGITSVVLSPTKNQLSEQVLGMEFRPYSSEIKEVSVYSFAPHSQKMEGQHMVNYRLLVQAGAVGFTDAFPNRLSKALLLESAKYTSSISDARIWVVLPDPGLGRSFQVWEGNTALNMGLEGMPSFVESAYLNELSTLVEYTGKSMVYPLLCNASVWMEQSIHQDLHLGTAAHYLWWSDKELEDFNEGYKFWPPLSASANQEALVQGFKSGRISFVCSDHRPYHPDARETAFTEAPFGQSTLASFSLAAWTRLRTCLQPFEFVQYISHNSRALLGLPSLSVSLGMPAEFTFWNPEGSTAGAIESPWNSQTLNGEILGRMVEGKFYPPC